MKLIFKKLKQKNQCLKFICFKNIDSTNIYTKKLALQGNTEGTVVIAQQQTAGKGRLGRSFLSPKGGVYFSLLLRPSIKLQDTLFITVAAAVAAAHAIEKITDQKCEIKWVNDIYINSKKVCGILTEGGFGKSGDLDYAVLGVGINLFEPKNGFPSTLPLAGSVFQKNSKIWFKNRLKEVLISEFVDEFFSFYEKLEKKEFIKEYQQRSFLTGKEIIYEKDGANYKACVLGIDDNANLIINCGGKEENLSHGEIQIIGMEQLSV